ncbi:PAS/PAC sensor hybrid histidine kinase [Teredinibacter turnerae T7901]|uniref:histidine kinase n=1 Tax=Teredinibacter turnerae (strain ATCC 39867 / T7901) TaxID=377629 RepID=C5BLX7_TERTT|nr:PAS domain-containing protein [Teredinibacter turnerae]ACR11966.1 PAS/PAC sensor hybrid histidine kinase [Teredinibacter turnerae T7901]
MWFKKRKPAAAAPGLDVSMHGDTLAKLQALERSVSTYERIFRGSRGYAFLDWDLPNSKMAWNGGFWSHLGYSDADMEFISNPDKFIEYVHPDDQKKLMSNIFAHLRSSGPGEIVFRIRKKKGGHIWAEARVDAERNAKGRVVYMSGIVFDVTKLKQTEQALLISEARHARIIQSSNDGIWEWSSAHGGFHFSNRCWEHLGFTEHDDIVNQGMDRMSAWRKRMHPDDLKEFDHTLQEHVQNRVPFDVEYRIRGKDEHWRWIRARGQMTYDEAGKPTRMSGTNMDVTEIKLAEERVLKAKEVAEEANRAKSDFLSSMSHELRTPLNSILGFAQLCDADKSLLPEQRANIAEIRRAGEHLLQLVGDVLDLAKIESRRMGFSLEPVTPARLLAEAVSSLQSQAEMRGISVTLEPACDESDVDVVADAVRLKQVFLNLLSNAIKYNVDGGSVHVGCARLEEAFLRVTVKDSGRGIAEHLQKQMYQPFNRLGNEASSIEGSGVGLVITKQLVEQMGGLIGFSSKENVGSEFWVDMPVYLGQPIEQFADDRRREDMSAGAIPALEVEGERTILYVEDNPPNQRLMKQFLVRYPNLRLEIAAEPIRGIYLARKLQPDLIVMDINLPGMDGFETLAVLKQDPITEAIPVIALTANALVKDIERGKESGFDYYLTKPLNLSQLVNVFNDLLMQENMQSLNN